MNNKVSVIGAGNWGTTLAQLLCENRCQTTLWAYEKEVVSDIKNYRENKLFLPGCELPASLEATDDINQAVSNSKLIIFVVPVQHLSAVINKINKLPPNCLLISAAKGIEIKSLKRPSQIIHEHFKKEIAVLSGPNLAKEIAAGLPAASVVASKNKDNAAAIQKIIMSNRFRIYTQEDVCGVELGGALKNIIAIAAGICDGLDLGENARAALIVRGITEISRLGKALGAEEKTFYGLSGIGDLILTAGSPKSRNHKIGEAISRGKKLDEIIRGMSEIAEGIPTTKAVYKLSQELKIDMPICSKTYQVLYKGLDPYTAITDLLTRKAKQEN
ncbi:MAG: NAD(P)-dependent glycerol-3-phosphate dehydrogenase [Candidatus Saganbacteria bacterium]|nr:NAD(P)-dependent glycerol-3-phosphate dehydrogenase [Candidatus Saganbacteria bacterium]